MVGNKDKYEFERVFFGSFEAFLSDGSAAFPEQASSEEVDSRLFYAPCLYTASPMSKLCKGSVSVFCEHMQTHTDTQPNSQTKTKQSMTMERMDAKRNRVCNGASQTASGFFIAKRRTAKKIIDAPVRPPQQLLMTVCKQMCSYSADARFVGFHE